MNLTPEMQQAFDIIENTKENLFITGKAGTGKTTFLKYLVSHTKKNIAVTASTGIAAINAGGVTLHRLFGIPFGAIDPSAFVKCRLRRQKAELFCKLDMLVIDEISMVRPDVLDFIDKELKLLRVSTEPFGGVQLVLFGDLFQLPPVTNEAEREILQLWYRGNSFFFAKSIRDAGFTLFELTKVFRQRESKFIKILNHIREYKLTSLDIEELSTLRDSKASRNYDGKAIHICSLRRDADRINSLMLGNPTHTFKAILTGEFKEKSAPCPMELALREGARVMTLVNDVQQGFYNGSMGTVAHIESDAISVTLDTGKLVTVKPNTWKDFDYVLEKSKVTTQEKGTCTQFPLALGWAITIHKSQGLTFDNIVVHCPYAFASGMLYVALSRCTSMKGIVTDFFIGRKAILPDNELITFEKVVRGNGNKYNVGVYKGMLRCMGIPEDEIYCD